MRLRLIKKFAERIDGIDLSPYTTGDTLDLEGADARLLLAEGWAIPERRVERRQYVSLASDRGSPASVAADRRGSAIRAIQGPKEVTTNGSSTEANRSGSA